LYYGILKKYTSSIRIFPYTCLGLVQVRFSRRSIIKKGEDKKESLYNF